MPFNQVVPPIQTGTISSILHEIEGPAKSPDWKSETLKRIEAHDPIMGGYLRQVYKQWGEECLVTALLMYRIIESQIEANKMAQDWEV